MTRPGVVSTQEISKNPDVEKSSPFSLTDAEFKQICTLIKELTGIHMGESKRQLIYRRLSVRLKARKLGTFKEYLACLTAGDQSELEFFSNAVTTNLTSFFREPHHFHYLANTIIPDLMATRAASGGRLRIWSAGCSTGEEPYSIAITLKESLPDLATWDAKLLCTDLDSDVLAHSEAGIFRRDRVDKIAVDRLKRWFLKGTSDKGPIVRVRKELQELMVFKQLNLMNEWPMRGRFDVIFCRNVIIYFDKPTQRVLMDRFANILKDGGYLIIGHSESLLNVTDRFSLLGKTIYQKIY